MAEKSPVSVLQELTQCKKLTPPEYLFEEIEGPKFKCTVKVGGKSFWRVATTKRQAKRESAQLALVKLQTVEKPKQSSNCVSTLNEYASKNHVDYPVYECLVTATKNGEVIVNCSFLGCEALGKGQNQKEAKQNAAKSMIDLYVSKGKCKVDSQRKSNESAKNKTAKEKSGHSNKAKKNAHAAKDKKQEVRKGEINSWGVQDLEKIVAGINTLGLNKGGQSGSASKPSQIQIVINLPK